MRGIKSAISLKFIFEQIISVYCVDHFTCASILKPISYSQTREVALTADTGTQSLGTVRCGHAPYLVHSPNCI